ncbi:semaphorin-4E-like [Sardina pilchardus]|uniref:semaphorin-4E-like n=1 Tax=Sardina pilchardus TaxID=27697 RepID=UPI002E112652
MPFLPLLALLCALLLTIAHGQPTTDTLVPRKSIRHQDAHAKLFQEDGVWNYTTMLLREDLGLLMLGAREAIYALNISDISEKKSAVYWRVPEDKQRECTYKGKTADIECRNYIRTLHKINATSMYVCGTNAFSPTCDFLTFLDGQLKLREVHEEGKGKCPFDPFQRYSSLMVGNDLYSATSINFLGSEPVVLRSSQTTLRTEFKSSWLNEPNFVYMDLVPESEHSTDGDDDKVYLFFSENAVEYDFYNKLMVSRVARVCKDDMGGQRTLQRKWTSFLKARLDCSVPEPSLPYIVQDVFLLSGDSWESGVFYAVFTPQSESSDLSAVCAYSVADIRKVFSTGKYKTPVSVETSHIKWVMFSGDVPSPRPGACINDAARSQGMSRSLDLPDKTLQFIRDRPLMDDAVRPLSGTPLLLKRGAAFTRIVVDSVLALDGQTHAVMFIGTENGFVQKAVNYDGKMHIIEEVQPFETSEAIKVLRLSLSTGQLYAGTESGAVQMPLSDCGRYVSCLDCVLARDPYCAWSLTTSLCSTPSRSPDADDRNFIQSLKEGDASSCPESAPMTVSVKNVSPGNNIQLDCQVDVNVAQVNWHFNGQPLQMSALKHYLYSQGLLIFSVSTSDMGDYTCQATENVGVHEYPRVMAAYKLLPPQPVTSQPGEEDKGEPEPEAGVTEPTVSQITAPKNTPPSGSKDGVTADGPKPNAKVGQITGLQVAVVVLALILLAVVGAVAFFRKRLIRHQSAGGNTSNGAAYQPASQGKTDDPRTDQNFNNSTTVTFSGKGTSNGPVIAISSIGEESEI